MINRFIIIYLLYLRLKARCLRKLSVLQLSFLMMNCQSQFVTFANTNLKKADEMIKLPLNQKILTSNLNYQKNFRFKKEKNDSKKYAKSKPTIVVDNLKENTDKNVKVGDTDQNNKLNDQNKQLKDNKDKVQVNKQKNVKDTDKIKNAKDEMKINKVEKNVDDKQKDKNNLDYLIGINGDCTFKVIKNIDHNLNVLIMNLEILQPSGKLKKTTKLYVDQSNVVTKVSIL